MCRLNEKKNHDLEMIIDCQNKIYTRIIVCHICEKIESLLTDKLIKHFLLYSECQLLAELAHRYEIKCATTVNV